MEDKDKIIYIPLEDIIPNRFQPRIAFDDRELNELANSIKQYGVIQPVVLRQVGEKYEIIAGERRYKASTLAGLQKIPAIINNTDDNTSAEIALLENLQRKNLTVIEESKSFKKLLDRGFTQEEIATKLGISQSSIANKLRLLNLPKQVQEALLYNKISERHARSLLVIQDTDKQVELLNRIISERLTVRQTEEEISKMVNSMEIKESNINDDNIEIVNDIKPNITENSVINEENLQVNNDVVEITPQVVPEVINIEEKRQVEHETPEEYVMQINPFQPEKHKVVLENDIKKAEALEKIDISVPTSLTDEIIISNEIEANKNKEEKDEQEDNFPKVVKRFRTFVDDFGEYKNAIKTTESDLGDKYQIIIEIDKNTIQ